MSVDRRMCQQVIAELWGDGAWVTTIATDDPGLGEVRWVGLESADLLSVGADAGASMRF